MMTFRWYGPSIDFRALGAAYLPGLWEATAR